MTNSEIYSHVDHTLLKPEATPAQIEALCDQAIKYHTASICINPCYVELAKKKLAGTDVAVCTVIGFPLGTSSTKIKCLEAQRAVLDGADECDMVINIGALKSGNLQYVQNEIACIKNTIGKIVLKVIIETCLLTDDEKRVMCDIVCNAGADFIKTSTGFSTGGATFDDIKIFAECVKGRCKIKAAGGIKTKDDMETFLSLGADRLGTSSAVNILEQE